MLNKEHNFNQQKAKIRKRDWKEKQDRKPKERELFQEKINCN